MKTLGRFSLILVFLLTSTSYSFACLCFRPENPKEALKDFSEVVFSGELISMDGITLNFEVERVWKGVNKKEIQVQDSNIGTSCASAIYIVGQRYVMFARVTNDRGEILTDEENKPVIVADTCSWISNLATVKGRKVLKKIGKGKSIK